MRSLRFPVLFPCVFLPLVASPGSARALDASPRAEYVGPEALEPEPLPHQLDLSLGARWTHVVNRSPSESLSGLTNIEVFQLNGRLLVGRTLVYCGGLEAHVGGSDTGAAYGATVYPIGVGLRGGDGAFVALCGGAGGDRVGGSVPWAFVFPAELSFGFSVGPLRPIGWARAAWIAGAAERRSGSPSISAVDELEAGLAVRLGRQRRYWEEMNAGQGPSLGIVYSEFMGARAIGITLALDLSGGQ
jgi:hypothetical protein